MTNRQTKENNHAISNAAAWLESIKSMVADLSTENYEDARQAIQESPLSVEVRSPWYSPGATDIKPDEFCILLSTGGPALRIIGDLTEYGSPESPRLQWQDWGTPWTDYYVEDADEPALLEFCQQFWFGE